MIKKHKPLAIELIKMMDEDYLVRDRLAKDGSLYEGYHPEMEEVHNKNGYRLLQIINIRLAREKFGRRTSSKGCVDCCPTRN